MTINTGSYIPDQPSGAIQYSSYTYTIVPDPSDIDQPAYKSRYEEVVVNHNITAINTGVPRFWEWSTVDFSFFPGNENPYPQRPGKSFNGGDRRFTFRAYSAGIPQALAEAIALPAQGQYFFSIIESIYWGATSLQIQKNIENKPSYYSLIDGYSLDSRLIPDAPTIIADATKTITIKYYKQNKLENIPDLKSICWMIYKCELSQGKAYRLPISDCVLGTLYCSDAAVMTLISSLPTIAGKYRYVHLMPSSIPSLFADWNELYDSANVNATGSPVFAEIRLLRKLAANNNVWGNATLGSDINPESTHPMFIVDEARSYDWHYKPVSEGIGDLIMDGPRTIESHAALVKLLRALQVDNYQVENLTSTPPRHYLDWYIKNSSGEKLDKIYNALDAEQWGTNPDDPEIPRVANLGHLISKIASLLGYRPEPNGTFDPVKEKALVRQIVNKNEPIDPTQVGVNNFGSLGMIMRRLNNSFRGKKITADECVILRDIPQIMAEYQDQLNLALGLQESSAIEIKGSDSTARYDNQLAVMIELLNLAKSNNESIRAALVSSLVAQAQSSEIIAALGLPTVTKSLPVQIDNKIDHLPYKGVSAHRSISQEIAVCTANVGIVLGQVL